MNILMMTGMDIMTEEDFCSDDEPDEIDILVPQERIRAVLHSLMMEFRKGSENAEDMIQATCLTAQENAVLRVAQEMGVKLE